MWITNIVRRKTSAYGILLVLVVNLFSGSFANGVSVSLAAETKTLPVDESVLEAGQTEAFAADEALYNVSVKVLNGQETDGCIYAKNALRVEFEYVSKNESADIELFWKVMDEDNLIKIKGNQIAGKEDNKKYVHQELFSVGSGSYILYYGLTIGGVDQITKKLSFVLDNTPPELNIVLDTESEKGKSICIASVQEQNFESGSIAVCRRMLEGEENWSEPIEATEADVNNDSFARRIVFDEDGIYTIQAVAKDKAGNQTETQMLEFVIDNSEPVLEFDGMENGGFYNDQERTLTLRYTDLSGRLYETASMDAISSEMSEENLSEVESLYQITIRRYDGMTENYHVEWKPEENMQYVSKADIVFGSETNDTFFAGEGRYTVSFYGQDAYGNKVKKPVEITFVIDRTVPDIPTGNLTLSYAGCELEPPEPRLEGDDEVYYFHGDVQLDFQIEESNYDSAELYIEESRDGSVFERRKPYGMEQKKDSVTVLYDEEGSYTARVWAKDKAGNYEGKAGPDAEVYPGYIRHFVVDKTAPVISITGITNQEKTHNPVTLLFEMADYNHDFSKCVISIVRSDVDGEVEHSDNIYPKEEWEQQGIMAGKSITFSEEGIYEIIFNAEDMV